MLSNTIFEFLLNDWNRTDLSKRRQEINPVN